MRAARASLVLPVFLLVTTPTQSQPGPPPRPHPVGPEHEVIIYRDRNFDGPAVSIRRDESNLKLVWTVNSARVRSGTWEICERPNFQGSCTTLSSSNNNLGHRRVQSVRAALPGPRWRALGEIEVNRVGFDNRVIHVRGNPVLSELRFCAERVRIRFHDARARFTNGRFQTLRLTSQIESGRCTNALSLTGHRNLTSVDVTASTSSLVSSTRGLVRLEGR